MTEIYETSLEIQSISAKRTSTNDIRYSIRSDKNIYYSGNSAGKYAVKGIEDLVQGDYITIQCEDSEDGKFHNIKKIMDVAKALKQSKDSRPIHETAVMPLKTDSGASGDVLSAKDKLIYEQVMIKELGESLRTGLIDKKTPKGQILFTFYLHKIIDMLGIKVDEKEAQDTRGKE